MYFYIHSVQFSKGWVWLVLLGKNLVHANYLALYSRNKLFCSETPKLRCGHHLQVLLISKICILGQKNSVQKRDFWEESFCTAVSVHIEDHLALTSPTLNVLTRPKNSCELQRLKIWNTVTQIWRPTLYQFCTTSNTIVRPIKNSCRKSGFYYQINSYIMAIKSGIIKKPQNNIFSSYPT